MPWMSIIGAVAGPVIGGLLGGDSSSNAAGAQQAAAANANATQLQMYNQNRADMEPWRRVGESSLNRLATLMGLQQNTNPLTADQLRTRMLPQFSSQVDERIPVDFSGLEEGSPLRGSAFVNSQRNVVDEQGLSAAIRAELAKTATTNSGDPQFGMLTKNFGMSDFQADPGYNFRLSEGLKALQNSAAARGSLMSGGTMKGLQRFGQNLASDEYTNAFNRYQSQNANLYNRLAGLSGTGQVQSQQMAAQGANAANTMGQNIIGAGNAQAAGIMGRSNAYSGAIGQGMNFYNQNRMLDMLRGGSGGGYDGYNDGPGYGGYDDGSFGGGGYSLYGQEMGY